MGRQLYVHTRSPTRPSPKNGAPRRNPARPSTRSLRHHHVSSRRCSSSSTKSRSRSSRHSSASTCRPSASRRGGRYPRCEGQGAAVGSRVDRSGDGASQHLRLTGRRHVLLQEQQVAICRRRAVHAAERSVSRIGLSVAPNRKPPASELISPPSKALQPSASRRFRNRANPGCTLWDGELPSSQLKSFVHKTICSNSKARSAHPA